MFIIYLFLFLKHVKEQKRWNCNNSAAFVKKNSSAVKTYEGLTVNADLPEQLSSFTDRINKNQMNNT